jgi:hypothetical protein
MERLRVPGASVAIVRDARLEPLLGEFVFS